VPVVLPSLLLVAVVGCGTTSIEGDTLLDTFFDNTSAEDDSDTSDTHEPHQDTQDDDLESAGAGVGDPCLSRATCTSSLGSLGDCLTDYGHFLCFPGGYCSVYCGSDRDCGEGSDCYEVASTGDYYFCMKRCTSLSDCRTLEGYSCSTFPGSESSTLYCLALDACGGP
jgi:hypothetical protein